MNEIKKAEILEIRIQCRLSCKVSRLGRSTP